jgi:hypothetical protein
LHDYHFSASKQYLQYSDLSKQSLTLTTEDNGVPVAAQYEFSYGDVYDGYFSITNNSLNMLTALPESYFFAYNIPISVKIRQVQIGTISITTFQNAVTPEKYFTTETIGPLSMDGESMTMSIIDHATGMDFSNFYVYINGKYPETLDGIIDIVKTGNTSWICSIPSETTLYPGCLVPFIIFDLS